MAGAGTGGRRQRQHADVGTAGAGRAAGAELAVSQVRWAFIFFGLFLMFSDCGREGGTRVYLYAQGARCEGLVCLLARVAVPLWGLQSHSICRGYRVHHAGWPGRAAGAELDVSQVRRVPAPLCILTPLMQQIHSAFDHAISLGGRAG